MVDMSPDAVKARLRELSDHLKARGFVTKGVDMTPAAVTGRLKVLAALSDMCLRLVSVGEGVRASASRETRQ